MKRPPAGTLLSIRLSAFYQQNGRPQAGKKPISQYITRRTSSCDAPDLKTSRGLWSGGGISSSLSIWRWAVLNCVRIIPKYTLVGLDLPILMMDPNLSFEHWYTKFGAISAMNTQISWLETGLKFQLMPHPWNRHRLSWDTTIQRCERACRIETIHFVDGIVNLLMDEKCHFETSSFIRRGICYLSIRVYCHAKQPRNNSIWNWQSLSQRTISISHADHEHSSDVQLKSLVVPPGAQVDLQTATVLPSFRGKISSVVSDGRNTSTPKL